MTGWRRCCGASSPRLFTKAEDTGANIDVVALAAVRATREATVARGREKLPSILGTPASGEMANGETFDGNTEVATFPGDLPVDPEQLFNGEPAFRGLSSASAEKAEFSVFCGFGRRSLRTRARTAPRCLTSALTAPSSSDRRQTAMSERPPHRRPAISNSTTPPWS